jgi:uncharacterized repeat protein (TIGR03803 family)
MSTLRSSAREGCQHIFRAVLFAVATLLVCATASPASAQTFTTLHAFTGTPDGASPFGGLVTDRKGNHYGTTQYGGTSNNGTVFEMSPPTVSGGDWTETVIWNFAGGTEAGRPSYQLAMDAKGNLYGEAESGGSTACSCGAVFVLVPPRAEGEPWTERVIYAPTVGTLGADVFYGGLTLDSSGALYGTQFGGGTFNEGLAFKITPTAGVGFTVTTLYNFGAASADSDQPWGPLTIDLSGNLYGVSLYGGTKNLGTAYKLTPPATGAGLWSNSILYSFGGGASGCNPEGNVILDKLGRLYGQATSCGGTSNNGVIFRLTPQTGSGPWVESVLHTFSSVDGGGNYPSLSLDAKADLFYGTSYYTGEFGVVFQLAPPASGVGTWTYTVLHTFTGGSDGNNPLGPIVWDATGVLYGTVYSGGIGYGTTFSITP